MIIDFIAQSGPPLWGLIAALVIVSLLISAFVVPELVEVYLGDSQLVLATLALAAIAVAFAARPPDASRQTGLSFAGRAGMPPPLVETTAQR